MTDLARQYPSRRPGESCHIHQSRREFGAADVDTDDYAGHRARRTGLHLCSSQSALNDLAEEAKVDK